jgi:GTPase SAR1 family protein
VLVQRILSDCQLRGTNSYCLNLDPAVGVLPYQANIDIRDTVNYKQVMKQYSLGPNGGILTSLNLFATRFDQVLGFVDKRAAELESVAEAQTGALVCMRSAAMDECGCAWSAC